MSTEAKNYGTAPQEGTAADEYDIDNTYYVKERTMSRKERINKFLLLLLPILLAVLLVGGFAFYVVSHVLERGGGRHGNIDVTPQVSTKGTASRPANSRPGTYPTEPKLAPAPAPISTKEKSHASSGSSACASNSKCADLGLIGDCCPTKQGVTLGCCD